MDTVNDVNLKRITYFLCRNEGNWYYPREVKAAMGLEIDERALQKEIELLYYYDIIERHGGQYGGVFDRTLKKVLMTNYGDLFDLPSEEFDTYFKNDNMLDYLQERVAQLELSLADARELQTKLAKLQGEHNHLKGHYFEHELLLRLLKAIIDGDGGLVGCAVSAEELHQVGALVVVVVPREIQAKLGDTGFVEIIHAGLLKCGAIPFVFRSLVEGCHLLYAGRGLEIIFGQDFGAEGAIADVNPQIAQRDKGISAADFTRLLDVEYR